MRGSRRSIRRMRGWLGFGFVGLLAVGAAGSAAPTTAPDATAPDTTALERELERILSRDVLSGAEVGIEIRALGSGQRVFSRNASRWMIPASNQKLLTIALGLSVLGPGFHFETALRSEGRTDAQGRLHGDLWVVGGGDPCLAPRYLDSERPDAALRLFVEALRLRGVRRVRGDLVLDDRLFDRDYLGPAWPARQEHKDYCAPVAALSLNGNCLGVSVRSGADRPHVVLEPATGYYHVDSELGLSRKVREMLVALARPGEDGSVPVRGEVGASAGAATFPVPVRTPDRFFGTALRQALASASIEVDGELRRAEPDEGPPDADEHDLYTRRSPLLPALRWCGKESDNLAAEHIFKRVGAQHAGQGSFASGARAMEAFLREASLDTSGLVVADGSGLSRDNRVSPQLMVGMLGFMYQGPHRDEFVRSLAISGVDGTLDQRMKEAAMQYRVRAKTGYLRQVSGLSGFALAGESEGGTGEVYAFSILVNGFHGGNAEMKQVQDDICRALVRHHP